MGESEEDCVVPGINSADMPFPRQPAVVTPRGLLELPPEIIEAGSAQCTYVSAKEASGILYFEDAGVSFQPDWELAGAHRYRYGEIESYSVRKGLAGMVGMRTLTLNVPLYKGGPLRHRRFRIGPQLAANADYILSASGVARK